MSLALTSTHPTTGSRRRWVALTALLVAEAVNLLDATIVQVAAPKIHAELGGPVSVVQWVTTAYTLAFALLLITGGRLGDIAGRRRIFRIGVAAFMLASLACALAPSVITLIAFRVVQGAAAALIIPQTIGLIKTMFHGDELSRALGSIGPVMGLAAVCGPVLGGVLTHADLFGSSWRSAFLVNVPLSVAVLALSPLLPENRAPRRPGLDPVGTLLAVLGTGLVVYPLVRDDDPAILPMLAMIGAGLLVLVAFGLQQRRSARRGRLPLVETSLFSTRRFPAALVTSTVFFAVTTGLTLVVVLQLQLGLGVDVLPAGLALVPWSAGSAAASWIAGAWLVRRFGQRVMFTGLVVLFLGILATGIGYLHDRASSTVAFGSPGALLLPLALIGIGHGLFTPAFFTAALRSVQPQEVGSAAGLLNAVQQLGATLGVAVLGSIYLHLAGGPGTAGRSFAAATTVCWVACALVALAASAATLMRPER